MTRAEELQRLADEDLMPLVAPRTRSPSRSSTTVTPAPPTRSPTGSSASRTAPRTSPRRRCSRSGAAARASTAPAAASGPGPWASSATGRSTCSARRAGRSPKLAFDSKELLERRPAEELTDTEALRRETAREVRGAISELPDDQSRVIQLAYFGGFSHSEIAEMLNEPLGTIKGRMRLGMDKIRATAGGGAGER